MAVLSVDTRASTTGKAAPVQPSDGSPTIAWWTTWKKTAGWPWLLAAVLLLGAVYRLIWGGLIEYKQDEAWLYHLVVAHCTKGEWAELGMPSSQHLRVPGLTVWVFYPLGHLFGVSEPTALTRGVALCNLAALGFLVLFAWRCIPLAEREPWLWAAALIAVNPLAVLFQRKLWPPCMLPLFCTLFLACWWYRDRRWGALAWGILGACLGQIHATGFLYAAAFLAVTAFADGRRVRWRYWLAGSALGAVPMVGWMLYLVRGPAAVRDNAFVWYRWLEGKFWLQAVTEPMGLGLASVFGAEYREFLRGPLVGGWPTFGAAALQLLAALLGIAIVALALLRWRQAGRNPAQAPSSSALVVRAGFLGFGLLLSLASVPFYRHYLLVMFPVMALWLARLALPQNADGRKLGFGRRLLVGVCLVNALSSALTLSYLHAHGGVRRSDFGPTYEAQVRETGQRPPHIPLPAD